MNLPGYNKEKKGKQVSQVLEQHGFITMQLTRAFTSLADTYGHIMRTKLAEVDLNDVVLNRRILCVLLPALEKAPDELANLGKVIIATLKAMMASGLGDTVEGEYHDLIHRKPTNSETPYLCILDEYGYYAVEGFAVVPAQARSLGFSVVFAGQDLPAFQKASKEEAASIGANTNIKICMKLEDPTETWDFFMKSAGESYVTHVESFQVDSGSVLGNYQDAKGAKVEKRARVDLLDLKEQDVGDMHIFFKSKIVRARVFYADPKPVKKMRLNHFLKVDVPSDSDVEKFEKGLVHFQDIIEKEGPLLTDFSSNEEVETLTNLLQTHAEKKAPLERAMHALKSHQRQTEIPAFTDAIEEDSVAQEVEVDYLNIFAPFKRSADHMKGVVIAKDMDAFSKPILSRAETRDQIEYVQRLCGKSGQQSMNIAIELIADMERGTQYPPAQRASGTGAELANLVDSIVEKISLKMQQEKENST